jgi:ketosteroid isomerase-like protein
MKRALIVAFVFAGCGHSREKLDVSGPPDQVPAIDAGVPGISAGILPEAWLVGDWQSDDGTMHEHWVAADGALYGVRFVQGGGFEASIIDDAGDGGALVRWTYADQQVQGPINLTDDPHKTGDQTMSDAGVSWRRGLGAPAPALEDADRAFFAATRDRGPDGWADFFAPDGVSWGGGEITTGHDKIRDAMVGLLSKSQLVWKPIASRMGPSGTLGFTVGTFEIRAGAQVLKQGSYETVWKQQPDGSWKVAADAGRPEN